MPIFWLGGFSVVMLPESCLYILEVKPVFGCIVCRYFLPSELCRLFLFMVSFAVQKLLSLIRSHLFIFAFIFITLEGGASRGVPGETGHLSSGIWNLGVFSRRCTGESLPLRVDFIHNQARDQAGITQHSWQLRTPLRTPPCE